MMKLDKATPHSEAIEEAVLGAILLDKTAIHKVSGILTSDCFYNPKNKIYYEAIMAVFNRGETVEMIMTTREVISMGHLEYIGAAYGATLTSKINSTEVIETHAMVLVEYSIRRKLMADTTELYQKATNETEDVVELLSSAQNKIAEASGSLVGNKRVTTRDVINKSLEDIEKRMAGGLEFSGIDSCSDHINKKFGGWQKGDLIILAGRPGMMKTGIALDMIRKMAITNKTPVAFFSLEMPSSHVINRWLGQTSGINYGRLQKHRLGSDEYERVMQAASDVREAPLFVDDTAGLTDVQLRATLYKWKIEHGIELAVVDYLQLMSAGTKTTNREQEISTVSRNLKKIAKELDIAIIALSQLSRAVEMRGGDKRPQLSDLRESGSIEQDSDGVIFIYRPAYYGITSDDMGNSVENYLELIVSKNRHGGLGDLPYNCDPAMSTFSDLQSIDNSEGGSSQFPTIDNHFE